jgi:very-short-patch-repair endonuclease
MPHAVVSERQRGRARSLRRTMTRAETLLWRYLNAHRIDGLGIRRQVPIGNYIADFICHTARIVIELDGETHDFESRQTLDGQRDAWFAAQGFAVLRFTNDDVMKNLEGVVTVIRETTQSRLPRSQHTALPNPPPQGGREQTAPSRAVKPHSRGLPASGGGGARGTAGVQK